MANIYTYTETVWAYHNTTRVSDESFEFDGIGAYAETTILGEDLGGLDNDLFLRGSITPSQGKLTQGLCCRLDFYAKQKTGQDYWDIENHLIYLKGDKNGQINQKLSLIGFQGYFDHMVLRLEVMPDAELALDGTIELADFAIDDVSLNVDLTPVMDAIEEQGEAAKLMSDLLGLMMGVYPSRVMQQDGSFIYYWHDQPLMAESTTIWRLDANVFAVSNDGGQTWTGQTSDGTVIAKMVYALQIQASQVILSDGSDIDETLGELSGHFGESGDFTLLENGYAAFVKRVTGSDPPVTGDYSATTIDGGKIKTNSVTANQINVVALDGTGELNSTGGTLKVSNLNGTVEISPSNPFRVTDSYGYTIGGLSIIGGKLYLTSTGLAASDNNNYVLRIKEIVDLYGDSLGIAIEGLNLYDVSRSMGTISMQSVDPAGTGSLYDQVTIDANAITVRSDRGRLVLSRSTGATLSGWTTSIGSGSSIWLTESGVQISTPFNHSLGIDSDGTFFSHSYAKVYLKNLVGSYNSNSNGEYITLENGLTICMTRRTYTQADFSGALNTASGVTGVPYRSALNTAPSFPVALTRTMHMEMAIHGSDAVQWRSRPVVPKLGYGSGTTAIHSSAWQTPVFWHWEQFPTPFSVTISFFAIGYKS